MTENKLAEALAHVLARVRASRPLIHHLTNWVVMNDTANATLAMGALPVMAQAPEEVVEITAGAQALLVNLGTLTTERIEAIFLAGRAANARMIPVILDPVGAGAARWRTENARRMLAELKVGIVRCNGAEAAALLEESAALRGVEDVGETDTQQRVGLAQRLARHYHVVAAVTGARDIISDGTLTLAVDNGHPLLKTITGSGCMATTLVACCAAVERDRMLAAATGLAVMGLAGERAAHTAHGPGSFRVALLDHIYCLTPEDLRRGAKVWTMESGSADEQTISPP